MLKTDNKEEDEHHKKKMMLHLMVCALEQEAFDMKERHDVEFITEETLERLLEDQNDNYTKDIKCMKKLMQHMKCNHAVKTSEMSALKSKCKKLEDTCNAN